MTASRETLQDTTAKPVVDLRADLSLALIALEDAYRAIRKALPDTPEATIVIKRDQKAWGHTTVARTWAPHNADDQDAPATHFEIMISGENLRRGARSVVATLLHETAHARNLAAGVLDTDVNGRHNGEFKTRAEDHGLTVTKLGWHGWTGTELDDAGAKRWARVIALVDRGIAKSAAPAAANLSHLPAPEAPPVAGVDVTVVGPVTPPKRGDRNLLKATCGCGHSIRVSRGVLEKAEPTCSACSQPFVAAA